MGRWGAGARGGLRAARALGLLAPTRGRPPAPPRRGGGWRGRAAGRTPAAGPAPPTPRWRAAPARRAAAARAVRLPAWRSRFVLFFLFLAFAALIGRAFWLQGMSTEFLQKQGESRYARTLELPATRGKITDRNGQVLASSLPVRAVWAIPDDV